MALTPVPHRVRSPPMQNTCHPIHRQTCPICDAHPAIIVTEGKRMWRPSADSARPLRPLGQAAAAPENQVIGGDAPRSGSNADGTAAKRLTCSRQAAKIRSLCEAKSRNPGVIEHRRVLGVGAEAWSAIRSGAVVLIPQPLEPRGTLLRSKRWVVEVWRCTSKPKRDRLRLAARVQSTSFRKQICRRDTQAANGGRL